MDYNGHKTLHNRGTERQNFSVAILGRSESFARGSKVDLPVPTGETATEETEQQE